MTTARIMRILATAVVVVLATKFAIAQPTEPKTFTVQTADNVKIAAQEWGNPNGAEILLIHGLSQSHLSWLRQARSELAKTFRIITYDMRGHGESDKPLAPAYYKDHRPWADELQAVIEGARLKRPVLVGWSYGGRIISEYLLEYGEKSIAGINFVGAFTKIAPQFLGPATPAVRKMGSENLAENISNTISFVRFLTAKDLPRQEFEMMLAASMVVPSQVRANLLARPAIDEEPFKRIQAPVLITHGVDDRVGLVSMAGYTANLVAHARTSLYEGVGHMPFWENPHRFNRELAAFVMKAHGR
jgi:pimeloyl-ACP methyl ester carboxylesterase